MAAKRIHRLGHLQLRILRVLWNHGPAYVADVQKALSRDRLAYTTVATMLRKMEDRGLVRHREDGRRFLYEAAVSEAVITRSLSNDLVDRLFGGNLADTIFHLLEYREISQEELTRLEQLIRQRKKLR